MRKLTLNKLDSYCPIGSTRFRNPQPVGIVSSLHSDTIATGLRFLDPQPRYLIIMYTVSASDIIPSTIASIFSIYSLVILLVDIVSFTIISDYII